MLAYRKHLITHSILVGLFVMLPTALCGAEYSFRQQALEYRRLGYEKQAQGYLDEALVQYRKAIELDPKYATPHNDIAILLEQLGKLGEAEAAYKQAIRLNPEYAQVHANLAMLYERQGMKDKASYHWLKRYQLGDPSDPGTQRAKQRVDFYVSSESTPVAYPPAQITNGVDPSNPTVSLKPPAFIAETDMKKALDSGARKRALKVRQEGYAYQRQGKYADAESAYRKAIQIDPTYAAPYNDLGVLLESQGKLADSEQAYRHALTLDPQYIQAHANLAMLYEHTQRPEEALIHWLKRYQLGEQGTPGTDRARERLATAEFWGALEDYAPIDPERVAEQKPTGKELPPVFYPDDPRRIELAESSDEKTAEEQEKEDSFAAQLKKIKQQVKTKEKASIEDSDKTSSDKVASSKDKRFNSKKGQSALEKPNVETSKSEPLPMLMGKLEINEGVEKAATPTVKLKMDLNSDAPGVKVSELAHYMQFSNDGITFSNQEPFSLTKKWFLDPGDGLKTVYVRILNKQKEPVLMLTDSIDFDTSQLLINVPSSHEARERIIKDSFNNFGASTHKFRSGTSTAFGK